MAGANCKFDELKPYIDELALVKVQQCSLRNYPDSTFMTKLAPEHLRTVKENWAKLEQEVNRSKTVDFYRNA